MKRVSVALLVILGLAIILPVAAVAIFPLPHELPPGLTPTDYTFASALIVLFAWLHLGAAGLFLLGLHYFKARLQRAYGAICVGLVAYGFSLVQFIIFAIYNLWLSDWALKGGKAAPILLAGCLFFFGLRQFARALHRKGWEGSLWAFLAVLAIGVVSGTLVGSGFDLEFAGNVASVLLSVLSAQIVLVIKRTAGPAYTNAMAFLFVALVVNTLALSVPAVLIALHASEGPFVAIGFALAGVLFLRAGYAFNKISEY